MSKIGRKPIDISNLEINVNGSTISYKGSEKSGEFVLDPVLAADIDGNTLTLRAVKKGRDVNRIWGLQRALLSNALSGAKKMFEKKIEIHGLGYKVEKSGDNLVFSLGYSHKIDFALPKNVTVDIDKSRQKMVVKSSDRFLAGQVSSDICALRKPEPYKGTGIKLDTDVIHRKAGKTKGA